MMRTENIERKNENRKKPGSLFRKNIPFYKFTVLLCGLFACILCASGEELLTVKGKTYIDSNLNGLFDNGEKTLPGVLVSDGKEITKSGPDGGYELNKIPSDRPCAIFIIVPQGYKPTGSFYRLTRGKKEDFNFGLIEDEESLKRKFSFIHAGDIQWKMAANMKRWREEMAEINRITRENGAKFHVISGDLTRNGNLPDLKAIRDVFTEFKIPFHMTFGGHDGLTKMKFPKTGNFIEIFGPVYYSWNYGGVHFISLVSEKHFLSEKEKIRQAEWLKNDLNNLPKGVPVIISTHIPEGINSELKSLSDEGRLLAVLMGHWHQHHCFMSGNAYVFCSSPWRNLDLGAYTMKARVITVDNGKITSKTIPLFKDKTATPAVQSLPNKIKLGKNWSSILGENGTRYLATKLELPLRLAWKKAISADQVYFSSPAIYDGSVYFGLSDGQAEFANSGVICLDAVSGSELWRTKTGHDIYGSVAAADGKVFALDAYGRVFALSSKDGKILWREDVNGTENKKTKEKRFTFLFTAAPLTCDKDTVYAAGGKAWAAFDFNGANRWRRASETEATTVAGICPGDKSVFVTTQTKIIALNKNNGKTVWMRAISNLKYAESRSRGLSTPVYHNGSVYFNHRFRLHKIDSSHGNELWASKTLGNGLGYTGIPAVHDGIVVVCTGNRVAALNDADGEIRWMFEIRNDASAGLGKQQMLRQGSSPAIIDDKVIFGGDDGWLYALDLRTGKKLQEIRIGVPVKASPAVSGSLVCISDYDGNIYGFCAHAVKK